MNKVKLAIIGAGVRGRYTYGEFIKKNNDICEVVAIVETKIGRRNKFKEIFDLPDDRVFENINDFFEKEKIADAVIVCSKDDTHFLIATKALQKGYHVLVEGPVANNLDKLVHLKDLCENNKDKVFMAAMPYRYSNLFLKLKEIIESKEMGTLVNINYNSYIGYDKYVHNFVRGNWRLDSDSAPIILTNSCYDLDILEFLINSTCKKISSFSELNHFTRKNMQLDMSELCIRCSKDKECPYYAQKIYLDNEEMSKSVHINPTKENIEEILKEGQYGQCVYSCDNNVCDNLISILKFKNNITATLNISAFTKEENKDIRLMFTHGEVCANLKDNTISIKKFIDDKEIIVKIQKDNADEKLIKDFISKIKNNNLNNLKSSVISTISSHVTGFACEFSNVSESVVDVDEFWQESCRMTKTIERVLF